MRGAAPTSRGARAGSRSAHSAAPNNTTLTKGCSARRRCERGRDETGFRSTQDPPVLSHHPNVTWRHRDGIQLESLGLCRLLRGCNFAPRTTVETKYQVVDADRPHVVGSARIDGRQRSARRRRDGPPRPSVVMQNVAGVADRPHILGVGARKGGHRTTAGKRRRGPGLAIPMSDNRRRAIMGAAASRPVVVGGRAPHCF